MKSPKNIPASVKQRLLNRAKNDKRPFDELLQYYAMERFLYRLSQSAHAHRFILKGALMLRVWGSPEFRPTKDVDMLGKTSNEEAVIVAQIQDILAVEVDADGLIFDSKSIQTERITEDADYKGIRIRFGGVLDSAKFRMQIDIGFSDIVYPEPEKLSLPTMFDSPSPRLLCYSRESAIAEKFEAMVKLGVLNSRMKDFYDIWLLSRQFDFDGAKLAEAIRLTFKQRDTTLPPEIDAFADAFIDAKQVEWTAFWKKLQQDHVPTAFREITSAVAGFLTPIASALSTNSPKPTSWTAAGSWSWEKIAKSLYLMEVLTMQNLDLECAKLAENLAKLPDENLENLLTTVLGILEEQGIYAFFLFLKSRCKRDEKKKTEPIECEIKNKCEEFLKTGLGELELLKNIDLFDALKELAKNLDNLILARDLLRQALVYARYHAKAKEKIT